MIQPGLEGAGPMTSAAMTMETFLSGDLQALAVRSGRIILILLVAFLLSWIVRRTARRLASRLAARQEARSLGSEGAGCGHHETVRDRLVNALPASDRRERAAQRARTLGAVTGSVAAVAIYSIAAMMCLAELGVNLAPLLAGAGIVGIALGFGAQSLVRDFLSGVFIVIEDQYGVGDIVDVGEATGVVEEVTLKTTRLRGLDGTVWHIPNGEIHRSGNKSQYWARVVLDVPAAYDADVDEISAVIKRTADEVWRDREGHEILEEPQVWGVEDFGPSSVAIRLAVKTLPGSQWAVARELRARLKAAFDSHGFEIPFPQRTVWVRERREVES